MNKDWRRKGERLGDKIYEIRNDITLIGDKHRMETDERLARAYELGYIDREEFDYRSDVVRESKYEHNLYWATVGLPTHMPSLEISRPTRVNQVQEASSSYLWLWLLIGGFAGAFSSCLIGVLLVALWPLALFIPSVITMIAGVALGNKELY